MNIIDTHSHIYTEEFDFDLDEVIDRAKAVGVTKILMPNIDIYTIARIDTVADRYPGYCLPMMGLHPTSITRDWENELITIKKQLDKRPYIAIGEIGIDLYWDKTFRKEQILVFEEQLRWSIEYNLPVSIHSRDAVSVCLDCIHNVGADKLKGVFHSFGGSVDELKEVLSLNNFMIGVNGVITFKNSNLSAMVTEAGLSNIIVETDAPFLTPAPYRGKRNESSYTPFIIEKLAEVYNLPSEEVADITSENAKSLFNL